jgi:hypothetical protein
MERGCGIAQPQHVDEIHIFRICGTLRLVCDTAALRHE